MKHIKMKYGFTLIELLVVVIIIAVLSAVALPMYKHAALKSRFSTVMPMAKAVADAQEVYYLGRNMYALGSDELDITPVSAEKTSVQLSSEETPAVSDDYIYVSAKRTDVPGARYMVFQKHSPNYAGNVYCEAGNTDADAICKSIGGVVQEYSMVADTNLYLVSGSSTGLPPGSGEAEQGDNGSAQIDTSSPEQVWANNVSAFLDESIRLLNEYVATNGMPSGSHILYKACNGAPKAQCNGNTVNNVAASETGFLDLVNAAEAQNVLIQVDDIDGPQISFMSNDIPINWIDGVGVRVEESGDYSTALINLRTDTELF